MPVLVADGAKAAGGAGLLIETVGVERGEGRVSGSLAIAGLLRLTVSHPDPKSATDLAGELAFALLGGWTDPDGRAEEAEWVGAMEIAPGGGSEDTRLSALVRLPLLRERPARTARPVLHPLRIDSILAAGPRPDDAAMKAAQGAPRQELEKR